MPRREFLKLAALAGCTVPLAHGVELDADRAAREARRRKVYAFFEGQSRWPESDAAPVE